GSAERPFKGDRAREQRTLHGGAAASAEPREPDATEPGSLLESGARGGTVERSAPGSAGILALPRADARRSARLLQAAPSVSGAGATRGSGSAAGAARRGIERQCSLLNSPRGRAS